MRKRFVWMALLVFAITVGIMACGGTMSDVSETPQIEESEKQGIGITFVDPNPDYSNIPECASKQRALAGSESEQVKLGENEYLVTGENQISDSAGNLTIDELQRKFEGTLTSSDSSDSSEEVDSESLTESAPKGPSRDLFDEYRCPLNIFCVRVRGMDYHECRPCVYEKVYHVNIELMKNKNDSPKKYWMNLHVGAYRNSKGSLCLLIFEKVADKDMRFCCRDLCAPSIPVLQRELARSMTQVLASAGIAVSAVAISTAAATLSYLIYPVLMAL